MRAEAPLWYIARDGLQHGPVSHEQMRVAIIQGALLPTDLIWHAGLPRWEPAHALLGIGGRTEAPPPLPPTVHTPPVAPAPTAAEPSQTAHRPAGAPAVTAGTTTGIIAIVFGVLGLIPPVGIGLALIGLTLGWFARHRASKVGNRTGVKLGTVAMALSAATFVIVTAVLVILGSRLGVLSLPSLPFSSDKRLAAYHGTYQCAGRRYEIASTGIKVDDRNVGKYSLHRDSKPAWASESVDVSYATGSFALRRNLVGTVFVDDDACMLVAKPK